MPASITKPANESTAPTATASVAVSPAPRKNRMFSAMRDAALGTASARNWIEN